MRASHWRDLLGRSFDTPDQALMTRRFSQPLGGVFAAGAFRFGISPNGLTYIGLVCMLAGSLSFACTGGWESALLAGVLWQIGFGFDCADGQLARAKGAAGFYGAWLDVACDHVRQVAIGLALLTVMLRDVVIPDELAIVSILLLLAGQSTILHTISTLKFVKAPSATFAGQVAVLRRVFKTITDTPVFLVTLCLLRAAPLLLACFCAGYGLMLIAQSWSLGRLRLRHAKS